MKGHDGIALHRSLALVTVTGVVTLIPAPGAGFQIVVFALCVTATGAFNLETGAGVAVVFRSNPTTGRMVSAHDPYGLFSCGDNAFLRLNSAFTLDGVLTFEIRPTGL